MAKKTWVNIGGTYRDVKTAWVNMGGIWKKFIPKGNIAGVWKEFIQYALKIYEYGRENILLVEGYRSGSRGSIIKNSDHIRLFIKNDDQYDKIGITTDTLIDVTEFNSLKMIYDLSSTNDRGNLYFKIDKTKNSSEQQYVARNTLYDDGTSLETTIDVSSLSGDFYVQVVSYVPNYNFLEAKIYAIWLE
ncbi:hypothetical protein [Bacillus badius]|uniref:Phage protein n=1 Tax=Bacillus badius TaxID=1455 RepID=A0ABR5AYB7_BACBA|nr:hypothetical protein [Bacillus badius]KIL79605.1 hypothetical protein SD77_2059 [Bacillus badius]MED4716300.1 hypothetical protein [Bacillus badius]